MLSAADTAAYWIGDRITDWTGYAAIRIPLAQATGPREVTLDLPGYMQINSYSCGAITAAMVVRYFRPQISFGQIYGAVNPQSDYGASTSQVIRGLRACGLRVGHRTKLRFHQIRRAIDQGSPVVVVIHNPGSDSDHWVTVYGYSVRPDRIFLATNGPLWWNPNRIARKRFERLWKPKGNGLICLKRNRPVHRTRSSR